MNRLGGMPGKQHGLPMWLESSVKYCCHPDDTPAIYPLNSDGQPSDGPKEPEAPTDSGFKYQLISVTFWPDGVWPQLMWCNFY